MNQWHMDELSLLLLSSSPLPPSLQASNRCTTNFSPSPAFTIILSFSCFSFCLLSSYCFLCLLLLPLSVFLTSHTSYPPSLFSSSSALPKFFFHHVMFLFQSSCSTYSTIFPSFSTRGSLSILPLLYYLSLSKLPWITRAQTVIWGRETRHPSRIS